MMGWLLSVGASAYITAAILADYKRLAKEQGCECFWEAPTETSYVDKLHSLERVVAKYGLQEFWALRAYKVTFVGEANRAAELGTLLKLLKQLRPELLQGTKTCSVAEFDSMPDWFSTEWLLREFPALVVTEDSFADVLELVGDAGLPFSSVTEEQQIRIDAALYAGQIKLGANSYEKP